MSTGFTPQQQAPQKPAGNKPKAQGDGAGAQSSQVLATRANYLHPGNVWDHVPGSDVAAGDIVVMGTYHGVADNDIPANEQGGVTVAGVYTVPKDSSTFTQGAKVNLVGGQASSSAGPGLGIASKAAAAGDAYVEVDINKDVISAG